MSKKLWIAITANNPLQRVDPLLTVLRGYADFPCDISVKIYIDYASQNDVDTLYGILEEFKGLKYPLRCKSERTTLLKSSGAPCEANGTIAMGVALSTPSVISIDISA